jgi:hypothetical protein
MLLNEVVDEKGTPDDFIGHAGGDNFIVITAAESAPGIRRILKERFANSILSHYNFLDREQGFLLAGVDTGQPVKAPLMTLSIGIVSPTEYPFADIREITELAAEARRQDT